MAERLDAVELEIRWQRLIALLAESALTVIRTSFSKIVSEGGDFGCLLYDRFGRMVAQDAGISSKLAPSPRTVALALQKHPRESLKPGDVLITNDPWLCCGHLYDISVIKPLFHNGLLVGFAECLAHVPDVGGSLTNDSREVYEEGICIPILRLIKEGEDNQEVWDLLRSNVRVPTQFEGDARAFIAALQLAERGLSQILDEYGETDLQALADQIIERSAQAMRNSIRENIPPGVYINSLVIDGIDSQHPLTIEVAIKVHDESITVDYAGTGPQHEKGINCTEVYTRAWTLYSIRCLVAPSIPYNQGLFDAVRVVAPEGSFLNARHPAAVRMKSSTGNFIPFAIFGAMARVVPDRIMAESGIKCVLRCFATKDDGKALTETHHFMGGIGARHSKDGISCMSFPAAGAETPVEMIESSLPLTVLYKKLVPDSGGAGRFRGGMSQVIGIRSNSRYPVKLLVQNMKVHTPAAGYAGGLPGLPGCNRVGDTELPGKATVTLLGDEVLEIRTAAGGGMFDPRERSAGSLRADVESGLITAASARDTYGASAGSSEVAANNRRMVCDEA